MAKRERSINWEKEEKQLLREIIKPYAKVIENKDISTNTNQAKLKAWSEITEQFNKVNKRIREKKQLLNQWKTMKIMTKKDVANYKREIFKTGGGPKPPSPDLDTQEMMEMIPEEFEVDFNEFDCDGLQQDIKSDDCETSMMTPVSQVVPIMTNFVTGDNGEMPFNAQTLQASSCLPNVIVIEESVPSGSDQQTPTASRLESRQTPKLSAKKKLLTKTFNFGESSYEDMHNYRKRDDERLQKEHELRMKNMAEIHNQVMINLKLQKEILEKFLNTI